MSKTKKPIDPIKARFNVLRSLLRRAWMRDPERYEVLNDPQTRRKYAGKDKRIKWEHLCAVCGQWLLAKFIQIDHIKPCGTFLKDADWGTFGPGLFCNRSNLQKICKECHKIKTADERAKR